MQEIIRASTFEDAELLAPILRPEDKREVLAAGSPSVLASLQLGVRLSKVCLTVEDTEGHPCMMVGVVPSGDPLVGYIWLLSSDIITRKPMTFLRQSKAYLPLFHKEFPVLTNAVDARNEVHIRWLKWMGFHFINTIEGAGPHRLPFHTFVRLEHV